MLSARSVRSAIFIAPRLLEFLRSVRSAISIATGVRLNLRSVRSAIFIVLSEKLEHVFLFERDVELPQERQVLRFESSFLMMLLLVLNVPNYRVELRLTIRKCTVSLLPTKSPMHPTILVNVTS